MLQAGLEQRQHLSNTPILTDASDVVGTHTSSAGTHAPSQAPAEGSLGGSHSAGGRQEATPYEGSADARSASTHGNDGDDSDKGRSQQGIGLQGGGGFGAGGSQYTVQDFKDNPKVRCCNCTDLPGGNLSCLLDCKLEVGLLGIMWQPQETILFLRHLTACIKFVRDTMQRNSCAVALLLCSPLHFKMELHEPQA